MATFTTTGRFGALTTYLVTGTQSELTAIVESINDITTYGVKLVDGDLVGRGSKRDISNIRSAVESVIVVASSNSNPSERYIELLETATQNNLTHGKSWACSGTAVDKFSLHPSWEGEQICYVYSS